ncbi:MAG: hypothetical protein IAI48_17375, partial [Candidatus Eremiobacteraeota bacterium]|nr:hypothetical protein [Candidatus Eremiobacteraeota bacterium]
TSSAPGFYNVDLQIAAAAPEPAGSTYTIVISRKATGREIGPPPYPVDTGTVTIPDWYPGGKALPADADVLTASGTADTPVPATCGAASRGRLAHRVIDRRTWTRITGITEVDSDERYWTGRTLLCEIERRHTETYDLTSGKRRTVDETTTSLGIARL